MRGTRRVAPLFTDSRFDDTASQGLTRLAVDPFEIEREAVIAMLERERRSVLASMIGLAMLAAGVAMLPNAAAMTVLLLLRAASFVYTHKAVGELERVMRARKPAQSARRVVLFAMCLTGITLALMLWPPPPDSSVVAVNLVRGVVVIVVTLIAVTLAALPVARDAMLASFWLTVLGMIILHPGVQYPALVVMLALIVIGIRIYSASTGEHIQSAAKVLVENRQLSEDLADALAHAEFLSWRDPLTGLFNRRKLFEETRIERSTQPRHLMTIDLDRFKAINDTYGHGVGDHVLIATADAIREWGGTLPAAAGHQAFRLGGEEFLVITRGLDDGAAADAAERLRSAIAQIARGFTEHPDIRISASIGLTGWRFGEGLDDALLRADAACYEAKNTGRNRVRRAA